MSDDRFDPRFDPAFQRGYDGPAPAAARKMAISSPPASAPVVDRQRQPDREVVERQRQTEREVVGFEELDEYEDESDLPRRANPFLIALGAVSLVLVGGGLYLISRVRDLFADTQASSDFDFVTLQVLMQAAPIIVGLGLATAIGILFIFAVRWGRDSR